MMLILISLIAILLPSMSCLEGPYIYDNHTGIVSVEEGKSSKLECYASDDFPITWHRDPLHARNNKLTLPNGELYFTGNILELPSITRDQRGEYVCTARTTSGSVSKFISVYVLFAPIMKETHYIHHFENKKLELRCIAEAYPLPDVVWTKDNITLSSNEHHQIIADPVFVDKFNTSLILSTESDYFGTYECRIDNYLGSSIMTFKVTAPSSKSFT